MRELKHDAGHERNTGLFQQESHEHRLFATKTIAHVRKNIPSVQ
jgi:hypothetical protein